MQKFDKKVAMVTGGGGGIGAEVSRALAAEGASVVVTDLDGVLYGLKFQLPAIVASGGGAVVNMGSVLGAVGLPHAAAYVASKHALISGSYHPVDGGYSAP